MVIPHQGLGWVVSYTQVETEVSQGAQRADRSQNDISAVHIYQGLIVVPWRRRLHTEHKR